MVNRCVCFDKTFSEMKKLIDKHHITNLDELKKYFIFGENCRTCLPYVELVLRTGKTEFDPIKYNFESLYE
jgi:NAD(P)H-nitrite reductase large subunit